MQVLDIPFTRFEALILLKQEIMKLLNTLCLIALLHGSLLAQTTWTYTGPNIGDWNDINNWDIGTVPINIGEDDIVMVPTFSQITIDIDIINDGIISITGVITNNSEILNNGEIYVSGGENYGIFQNNGGFNTSGTFENFGGFVNQGSISTTGNFIQSFVFDNSGTITNSGVFQNNAESSNFGTIENESTFINNSTIINYNTLYNEFNSNNAVFDNNGTISNLGTILNEDHFDNDGTIINDGTIENNATFDNSDEIDNDGVFKGSGELIQSSLFTHTNSASIEPGNSIGTLTITGNMNFGGATFKAELDGMNMTSDLLDVSGNITLTNSTLDVTWLNPPTTIGTYDIIEFNARIGAFAQVNIPSIPGYNAVINYATNAVQIIVTVVLPVDFISFNGQQIKSDIQLEWTTSTEINNEGYYIERRTENRSWESVGFVGSQNNTNQVTRYNYIDTPDRPGDYLYRLRQIDFDGNESYSDVIAVKYISDDRSLGLSDFKRSGLTDFYFDISTDDTIDFVLYDAGGRMIHQEKVVAQQPIDLSFLSTGMYFYSVQHGAEILTGKVFLE